MNHYYTKLSFEKLEQFDIQRSNLSTFVLIRNTLIHALTQQQQQQQQQQQYYYQEVQDMVEEEQEQEEEEFMEQQIWLDSCFNELEETQTMQEEEEEEEEEEDSDEDDMIPLSPQDHAVPFSKKKPTFYINEDEEEDEDGLLCYDIPFLSLNTHSI